MEKWSAPAMTGSDASGTEKSGSGSPASPLDVTSSLFQVSVVFHILAGLIVVIVLGATFGWLVFAGATFALTGYWMILVNTKQREEKQAKMDAAFAAERIRSSRFTDPRGGE